MSMGFSASGVAKSSGEQMLKEECLLLIIDVQERLLPAMSRPDFTLKNVETLCFAADLLEVPVVITEQYPKGLGPTVPTLQNYIPAEGAWEKSGFSAFSIENFKEKLLENGHKRIIVCGIESHVCVTQTVLDLLHQTDAWVYVVADGVDSRTDSNRELGLDRMEKAGARIVCTEMALFEWLQKAGTPEFKQISQRIKD